MNWIELLANYQAQFVSLAVIATVMAISPGADFALVTRQSIAQGRRAGQMTALGISAGILVHIAYCVTGLVFLIQNSQTTLSVIKYLGATYLIYLGVKGLASRKGPDTESGHLNHQAESSKPSSYFLSGFLSNALNPKTSLFFLSIFTQLVSKTTPLTVQLVYGVEILLAHLIWFSMLSVWLTSDAVRNKLVSYKVWIDRVLGVLLVFFGLQILL